MVKNDVSGNVYRRIGTERQASRDLAVPELLEVRGPLDYERTLLLPPEEYVHVLGLSPFDVQGLNQALGSLAQHREGFFINCWYLFDQETAKMWKNYGKDGVAVCSRYNLLKSVLDSCEGRAYLGLVRYGSNHLTGWNTLRFITTKKEQYAHEQEVRALIWVPDELAGINRHFDENNIAHSRPLTKPPDRVPTGLRRRIDLGALLTEIVVSPWAAETMLADVEKLTRTCGYSIPVRQSGLTRFKGLLP
jgi:hypothetical protein